MGEQNTCRHVITQVFSKPLLWAKGHKDEPDTILCDTWNGHRMNRCLPERPLTLGGSEGGEGHSFNSLPPTLLQGSRAGLVLFSTASPPHLQMYYTQF
jgi:hypothetical protein